MASWLGWRRQEQGDHARCMLVARVELPENGGAVAAADESGLVELCAAEGTIAGIPQPATRLRVLTTALLSTVAVLGTAAVAAGGAAAGGLGARDIFCGVLGLCSTTHLEADGSKLANDYAILPGTIHDPDETPSHIRTNTEQRICIESDALGRDVQLWPCNVSNPNQQWIHEKGTGLLKSRYHPKCLKHHGKEVSLAACTTQDDDLKWVRHPDTQHLSNAKGECLDASGKTLHMQTCNHAKLERMIMHKVDPSVLRWEHKRWPSGPVHIKHASNGYCLHYPPGGMMVHTEPCDSAKPSEQWVWFKDTRQIMTYWHHRCLEAGEHDGPYAGMTIVGHCDPHNERQRWYVSESKRHISVLGMCLHTEPGKMLMPCSKGTPEVWHIKPLSGHQDHRGGVETDRIKHPFFQPPEIDVPPRKSREAKNCHHGSPKVGKCGAERLHHPDAPPSHMWERLRYELWKVTNPYQVVVHIGDHRGLLFRYGGEFRNKPIAIASEVKPMTGVLAMRLVEIGILGLDDKVNRWLDWWPTSTADSRSYITLRHCLAFTTGFYGFEDVPPDTFGHEFSIQQDAKTDWWEFFCRNDSAIDCAKLVLKHTKHFAPPGTTWTYTADHLRIAAAMMEAATHKPFGVLMHEHVFSRTAPAMVSTHKYPRYKYWNPSSHAISTARDYQRFLDGYFNGLLVSNQSQMEIESDQQLGTKVRWFKGVASEGRPKDHGLFGLGWWRSRSTKTLCGVYQFCTFAPSHYASVAVVERKWPEYLGNKKCDWKRSSTCSYYFHFQNVNLLNSYMAKKKFRSVSHIIERHATHILSGNLVWQNKRRLSSNKSLSQ